MKVMRRLLPVEISPWMLPLVVVGLVVPAIAAFSLLGPQVGLAAGALTVAVVIVIAARLSYEEEIEVAGRTDSRYRLLLVATDPVDDPRLVERIAELAAGGAASPAAAPDAEPRLRVVAPARTKLLDRWASDVTAAREHAQRTLTVTIAALAAAGLEADGRVGDSDPVQALADELAQFPAQEVALVTGPGVGREEIEQVRRRLDRPVRELSPG